MKQGILFAVFGASGREGESVPRLFSAEAKARFPDIPVRFAFTSPLVRERLARERKKTDSVLKALGKMRFEGYSHVAVQPLQCIPGREYAAVVKDALAAERSGGFYVRVGAPLLADESDIEAAAEALVRHAPAARAADEAVLWVGHGSAHPAASRYAALGRTVGLRDPLVRVGTLSGGDTALPCLLECLGKLGVRRIWLQPLLSVVGRHALRDLAGPEPESWKSQIEARGSACLPVLKGSAEYPAFIRIWLDHLAEAFSRLLDETGCARDAAP